jgi:2-polyprenyl-3-methyl-5-hydroxy-6-metoxy-1,4-benzoquinol methylase
MTVEKCPFCFSTNLKLKRKIISPINNKEYFHYYCKNCELEFFTPLVFEDVYTTEIKKEYIYFHKGRKKIPEWTKNTIRILKKLGISLNNKKILEIGAGDCINFKAFKKEFNISNKDYYVIELDKKSTEVCKKKGIKNIINKFFDKKILNIINTKFDIILCFEVLEHQTNPKEFLETCFKLLNKDGLLIITVPNREMSFHKYKEIPGDIPPHHFLRFNKKFFVKNFKDKLVYVGIHRFKNKTIKKTCKILSYKFLKNYELWWIFIPFALFIRIFDIIAGEN